MAILTRLFPFSNNLSDYNLHSICNQVDWEGSGHTRLVLFALPDLKVCLNDLHCVDNLQNYLGEFI